MRSIKNILCLLLAILSLHVKAAEFFKLDRFNDESYCAELSIELNKNTKVVGKALLFKKLQTAKGTNPELRLELAPTSTDPNPLSRSIYYRLFDIDNDFRRDLVFRTLIHLRGSMYLSDWYVNNSWNEDDSVKQYLESLEWIRGQGFKYPKLFSRPFVVNADAFKYHNDKNNEITFLDYQNQPITFKDKNLVLVNDIHHNDHQLIAVRFENKEQILVSHLECLFNYSY